MTKTKKSLKKKIMTGAVASTTFLGVIIGNLFGSPEEIINFNDEDETLVETALNQENRVTIALIIKKAIFKIPFVLRLIICLPLWALGTFTIHTASKALKQVLSPTGAFIAKYLIMIAVLILMVILCAKMINPNLKLKDILNKRTVITCFATCLILLGCDLVVPMFLKTYDRIELFIHGGAYLLMLIICLAPLARKEYYLNKAGLRNNELLQTNDF